MDITLYLLTGFLCFIIGMIIGAIVVYRVFDKEEDTQYELLKEMNKNWGDYCRSLIHEFYENKIKELEEKDDECGN